MWLCGCPIRLPIQGHFKREREGGRERTKERNGAISRTFSTSFSSLSYSILYIHSLFAAMMPCGHSTSATRPQNCTSSSATESVFILFIFYRNIVLSQICVSSRRKSSPLSVIESVSLYAPNYCDGALWACCVRVQVQDRIIVLSRIFIHSLSVFQILSDYKRGSVLPVVLPRHDEVQFIDLLPNAIKGNFELISGRLVLCDCYQNLRRIIGSIFIIGNIILT